MAIGPDDLKPQKIERTLIKVERFYNPDKINLVDVALKNFYNEISKYLTKIIQDLRDAKK